MFDFKAYFAARQDDATALLQGFAEIESPSYDKGAVSRMADKVAQEAIARGAAVERLPGSQFGDQVIARWSGATNRPGILMLCHMDTVWPVGTLAERPVRIQGGRMHAPGAYDMKAGIVICLEALLGLDTLDRLPGEPLTLLCTADEETGSHESRATIEALAAESRLVLCMEPALPGGVLKTARKGVGGFDIHIYGRAAHAGADHQKGVNAIEEMAHQVLALQKLTRYESGTTVNVGVIHGGSASNVVPAECHIEVDFRVSQVDETDRIMAAVHDLKPHLDGARIEIQGGLNRPPMVRDALMERTFRRAAEIAHRHGFVLHEASTGGASDANFTAGMHIPTLDGLGADGDGGHAISEHVILESLPARAALLAALLSEW